MSNTFSDAPQVDSKQVDRQIFQRLLKNLYRMRIALKLHGFKVRHHHDKASKSMIRVYQK